jgi:alpha-D-ribose 1-methylphosphonate 5-triphosphate diphosphatase
MEQIFRNARIVAGDELVEGALIVRDGRVLAIEPGVVRTGEDMWGDIIAPGIIDLHTDNLEKHYFPRPNIGWDPVSAAIVHDGLCASVGVTTVYDSLSVGSFANLARTEDNQVRLVEGLAHAARAGLLRIDHRLHWRCELPAPDLSERLEAYVAQPLTGLVSLMDHTPGQRQYKNLDRFIASWKDEGINASGVEARIAESRARQTRNVEGNRRLVVDLARARNVPIAAHDDETVEHVDVAADAGATIAEFPVTIEAAERARARGMSVIMGGPNLIRGGSYSGNVQAAEIAQAGLLDGFASDYVPRSLIECAVRLTQAPFNYDLARAWATVSRAPARALGLADRGELAPDLRADMLRVRIMDGRPILRGVWVEGRRAA